MIEREEYTSPDHQNSEILDGGLSWEEAKEIMGVRAIGVEVAKKLHIKVNHPEKYLTVPFDEEELKQAKERGMYLVAMPKITLFNLDHKNPNSHIVSAGRWHATHPFFTATETRPGVCLLGNLPDSGYRSLEDQKKMLPDGFEIPQAVEFAYLVYARLIAGLTPKLDDTLTYWTRTYSSTSFSKFAGLDLVNVRVGGGKVQLDRGLASKDTNNIVLAASMIR